MGGYNSIGLKIDDYDPNNGDHIAKIGGYLFNNAVTANGANVMAVRLLDLINFNTYNETSCGTKVKLESGAEIGAVESGGNAIITLAGGTATTVFTYDATSENNGDKSYSTGYKTDGKISFGDIPVVKSIYGLSSIDNDTTLTANISKNGFNSDDSSLELKVIGENNAREISWYNESQGEYTTFKFTGSQLKKIYDGNNQVKCFCNIAKGLFLKEDWADIANYISDSGATGTYSVSTQKTKGIDGEIDLGLKAIVGAEVSLFLSGVDNVSFDTEQGALSDGRNIKKSEAQNIESLVDAKRVSLGTVFSEPIIGLKNILANVVSKVGDRIKNGVYNGAAAVKGGFNGIVNIFRPNTQAGMYKSYMLMALPNEYSPLSETYVAVTVGEPYIIRVSDENENEISTFDPLALEISFDDTMLAAAGIASDSSLIDSMKIYYWDAEKNIYICQGGTLDKANRKVLLDITKSGQYILAIDNLAPDVNDFVVSNHTDKPVISAYISDFSGINEASFKFYIDENLLVSGENFKDYYDFSTGKFSYAVQTPLTEGEHIASIMVEDSSGNALPEAKICQFMVDATPPTIENLDIPQQIDAGDKLTISATINEADRAFVYLAYPQEDGWSEFAAIHMSRDGENTWETTITNTTDSNRLKVKVLAYDSAGNKAESQEYIVNIVVDKAALGLLINQANQILLTIEEGTETGRYQIGTFSMLETAIDNAKAIISDANSTQEQIDIQKNALASAIEALDSLLIVDTSAMIKEIYIDGQNLSAFTPTKLVYTIELPAGTTIVPTVTATPIDSLANVVITQANALPGTVNIKVTAKDAVTTKTYTINFTLADEQIDECFIATAAFGSKFTWPVVLLRHFRDQYLLTNSWGETFVRFYYQNSPSIAAFIAGSQPLKILVRVLLAPIIAVVYLIYHPLLMGSVLILLILFLAYRIGLRKRYV